MNENVAPPSCLMDLENAMVKYLPTFIERKRRTDQELFAVRPHFYDTCAPECYFYCAFIYTDTANETIKNSENHGMLNLWQYGEECGDHWEAFHGDDPDSPGLGPVLEACYEYLCDESDEDAYNQYATAICRAAKKLNSDSGLKFENTHSCFAIIPADAACEALNDAEALQHSLPDTILDCLGKSGFIDTTDRYFGIFPSDIYPSMYKSEN